MTALLKYDAARRAIAEAKAVDEVKDIRDKAEAIRIYAHQAKNREMEINCAEIRFRAERRIGEIKAEFRAAGKLHKGGKPPQETPDTVSEVKKIKLSDLGVDERMSRRVDELAEIEPDSFERLVARWRAIQEKSKDRVTVDLLKEEHAAKRKAEHETEKYAGGTVGDLNVLISMGCKYSAILADPPWHFVARSEKGEGRSASQHYPTDRSWDATEIKSLPVPQLAADDSVLFLWMVDWNPKLALEVIEAWGFKHQTTAFTWVKQRGDGWHFGQGYWTRANPESCWLATRGSPKRIHADVRQLMIAPVREHSRKPDETYERIERLVGGPYLELYARQTRSNWMTWGNQVPFVLPKSPNDAHPADHVASSAPAPIVPQPHPGASAPNLELPGFLKRKGKADVPSERSESGV